MASAANSNSAVNFHFEELKRDIASFTAAFSDWVEASRKVAIEDKAVYLKTLAEEHDAAEELKKQHEQLLLKKQQLATALDAEEREFNEIERANAELASQRDSLHKRLEQVKSEAERLGVENAATAETLNSQERQQQLNIAQIYDELGFFLRRLGLQIEATAPGYTRFTFTKIDASDWERKFFLVLNSAELPYFVSQSEPALPDVGTLNRLLNEDRGFLRFLITARQQFAGLLAADSK